MRRRAIFSTAQRVDFNVAALSRGGWPFTVVSLTRDALTTRDLIRKAGEPSVCEIFAFRDFTFR